eukprot:COSAG02_NODE_34169_length_488_cov_1.311054_1_plen_77_part_10
MPRCHRAKGLLPRCHRAKGLLPGGKIVIDVNSSVKITDISGSVSSSVAALVVEPVLDIIGFQTIIKFHTALYILQIT